jgi:hypothetical protein
MLELKKKDGIIKFRRYTWNLTGLTSNRINIIDDSGTGKTLMVTQLKLLQYSNVYVYPENTGITLESLVTIPPEKNIIVFDDCYFETKNYLSTGYSNGNYHVDKDGRKYKNIDTSKLQQYIIQDQGRLYVFVGRDIQILGLNCYHLTSYHTLEPTQDLAERYSIIKNFTMPS